MVSLCSPPGALLTKLSLNLLAPLLSKLVYLLMLLIFQPTGTAHSAWVGWKINNMEKESNVGNGGDRKVKSGLDIEHGIENTMVLDFVVLSTKMLAQETFFVLPDNHCRLYYVTDDVTIRCRVVLGAISGILGWCQQRCLACPAFDHDHHPNRPASLLTSLVASAASLLPSYSSSSSLAISSSRNYPK